MGLKLSGLVGLATAGAVPAALATSASWRWRREPTAAVESLRQVSREGISRYCMGRGLALLGYEVGRRGSSRVERRQVRNSDVKLTILFWPLWGGPNFPEEGRQEGGVGDDAVASPSRRVTPRGCWVCD